MKTYVVSDYQDWSALSADMTSDLLEAIKLPVSVVHKAYGACSITNLTVNCSEASLHIMAAFKLDDGQMKQLALDILIANKLVELDYTVETEIKSYFELFKALQKEVCEVQHDRNSEKFEADRQAKEEAKKEAAYQQHRDKAIQDFEVMTRKEKSTNASGEFYYNLGWLAKNVGTVSAALPDYLLRYFENHFGTEAKPTVVDSRKRTVNGYPIQWALSMKASVPKKVVDSIPAFLKQYLNPTGNALTNTTFIWDIVENYGFQFGRKQDLEKIRATIPATCLEQFEKGFAL
jgi:hypothetical protein